MPTTSSSSTFELSADGPCGGSFRVCFGAMTPRTYQTATALKDGRVLMIVLTAVVRSVGHVTRGSPDSRLAAEC